MSRPDGFLALEGKLWLLISICFFAIGWLKGLNLILLLAYLMLVLLALNFFLAGRGLHRLEVRRRIERPAFAGQPFTVEIELHNPDPREQFGVGLTDRGPKHRIQHFQVRLGPGETVRICRPITIEQRCCYGFQPVQLWSGLPFGLVRRSLEMSPDEALAVYPRLGRIHHGRLTHLLRHSASSVVPQRLAPRPLAALATEFHGLRPYRPGDSPRWIHWRTSARKGELMVREFDQLSQEDLVVVLEPWQATPGSDDPVLEEAISLAATLCWDRCRRPQQRLTLAIAGFGPIVLGGDTGPGLAERMLECLASQQGSAVTDLDKLLERLETSDLAQGAILALSTRSETQLAEVLSARFHRPVVLLTGSQLREADFYEPPARPGH